jgi:hypothetical protein
MLAKCVRHLVLTAATAAWPAMSCAQQPSQPLTPGLPVTPGNRSGLGAPAVAPIPDTSKKTTSTPAEKPVTPAQPPTALAR